MQHYQFFPIDRYAECILFFLQWLVRALGLKYPRHVLSFSLPSESSPTWLR